MLKLLTGWLAVRLSSSQIQKTFVWITTANAIRNLFFFKRFAREFYKQTPKPSTTAHNYKTLACPHLHTLLQSTTGTRYLTHYNRFEIRTITTTATTATTTTLLQNKQTNKHQNRKEFLSTFMHFIICQDIKGMLSSF